MRNEGMAPRFATTLEASGPKRRMVESMVESGREAVQSAGALHARLDTLRNRLLSGAPLHGVSEREHTEEPLPEMLDLARQIDRLQKALAAMHDIATELERL